MAKRSHVEIDAARCDFTGCKRHDEKHCKPQHERQENAGHIRKA
jgi:hypothetical protein